MLAVCLPKRARSRFWGWGQLRRSGGQRAALPEVENVSRPETSPRDVRYNAFGIQMLPRSLYNILFRNKARVKNGKVIGECLEELKKHGLLSKQKALEEVDVKIPKLKGKSLEEHFWTIGEDQGGPYRRAAEGLKEIPEVPKAWLLEEGWTKYGPGAPEKVPFPPEECLVLDVEVCQKAGKGPTLAVAAGAQAWYGWVSRDLIRGSARQACSVETLIPLEPDLPKSGRLGPQHAQPRLVVGHNVSYDRARVREQYWIERTALRFLDTLSLHVCVSGVTSHQRALLKAGMAGDELARVASLNSLAKVIELYCGTALSKEERSVFMEGTLSDVRSGFQQLMAYCAGDVLATFQVLRKLLPLFLERFPHPVTLAGMLELQSAYLPVNSSWARYLEDSERAFQDLDLEAKQLLADCSNEACQLGRDDRYKSDLWMWDQDWSVQRLKLNRKGRGGVPEEARDPEEEPSWAEETTRELEARFRGLAATADLLPLRPPLLPGYPAWYRKLCPRPSEGAAPGPSLLSPSLQIAPKLLRLTWNSLPLHFLRGSGWGVLVPTETDIPIDSPEFPTEAFVNYCLSLPQILCSCADPEGCSSTGLQAGRFCRAKVTQGKVGLIKLPHKDGGHLNVGNPLARDFVNKFSESGLSGSRSEARKMLDISKALSYWRNNRERIGGQMVGWLGGRDLPPNLRGASPLGAILPLLMVSGTLTRRAVEPTWLTASNASQDRVGSELRCMVQAPPGFSIVGADVDSQELWIAALLGDSYRAGEHGATPFGWMTLVGSKAEGSDLHSVTAQAVGISRGDAKVLNYARIYGAGQKFSERLLRQFNPSLSSEEASGKASKIFSLTKGRRVCRLREGVLAQFKDRVYSRTGALELTRLLGKEYEDLFEAPCWAGGTESAMFSCLEEIANRPQPATPFLGARLSRSLEPARDPTAAHLPTRINWVVQSGAVDFLHLMLVAMTWLAPRARFVLSFHDEVRYLVPEGTRFMAALALHMAHLLTRAFCVTALGMTDLPASVAFFSSVDVDRVLRKEAGDENRTPSNPQGLSKGYGVPAGESLDIYQAVSKALAEAKVPIKS